MLLCDTKGNLDRNELFLFRIPVCSHLGRASAQATGVHEQCPATPLHPRG